MGGLFCSGQKAWITLCTYLQISYIYVYIYVRMLVYYIYRKQFPNNLICLAREILRNFHNCFQRKKIILNAHIYGIHGKNVFFFIFHLYNTEEEKKTHHEHKNDYGI